MSRRERISDLLCEADARRDAKLRAVAMRRFKTLMRWLKKGGPGIGMSARYYRDGIEIPWKVIFGETPGPRYLIFRSDHYRDRAEMNPGEHGHIQMNLLNARDIADWPASGEGKYERVISWIKNALFNSSWRDTFIHEFVHWQDMLQRGARQANVVAVHDTGNAASMDAYLLSPLEFNAYFQQGATAVEQSIKHHLKMLARPSLNPRMKEVFAKKMADIPRNARAFVELHTSKKSAWPGHFVSSTVSDQKQKRRFVKRLTGLHDYLMKRYGKQLQAVLSA